MCGESNFIKQELYDRRGSPPHVWGKLEGTQGSAHQVRITPTCVGKAPWSDTTPARHLDHPHMCGES